jgi:hypothetical protein
VTGLDDEVRLVRAHPFVLGDRQLQLLDALPLPALADEVDLRASPGSAELALDLLDATR